MEGPSRRGITALRVWTRACKRTMFVAETTLCQTCAIGCCERVLTPKPPACPSWHTYLAGPQLAQPQLVLQLLAHSSRIFQRPGTRFLHSRRLRIWGRMPDCMGNAWTAAPLVVAGSWHAAAAAAAGEALLETGLPSHWLLLAYHPFLHHSQLRLHVHVVVQAGERVVQGHVVLLLDAQQQRAVRRETVQERIKHLRSVGGKRGGGGGGETRGKGGRTANVKCLVGSLC